MMTKEQYLKYLVELDKTSYNFLTKLLLRYPSRYTLDKICTEWIFSTSRYKYREDLRDYLHLTYADLLDDNVTSSNVSYQDILDAL